MGIAQIPLASSGASLAEITTAIQTNAAPASVTNASIATQVANNASPVGGTWTNLAVTTALSANQTYTGLSAYKYLRFQFLMNGFTGGGDIFAARFNGDSSANYHSKGSMFDGGGSNNFANFSATYMQLGMGGSDWIGGLIQINNNSGIIRIPQADYIMYGSNQLGKINAFWNSTATISSINFFTPSGRTPYNGFLILQGAN